MLASWSWSDSDGDIVFIINIQFIDVNILKHMFNKWFVNVKLVDGVLTACLSGRVSATASCNVVKNASMANVSFALPALLLPNRKSGTEPEARLRREAPTPKSLARHVNPISLPRKKDLLIDPPLPSTDVCNSDDQMIQPSQKILLNEYHNPTKKLSNRINKTLKPFRIESPLILC